MAAVVTPSMPSPTTTSAPLQPGYQGSAATAAGAGSGAGASGGGGGGIGTFFAVLAAVLVLTLLSCIFGRVCAAQAEGPDERYDCGRIARRWRWWRAPPPRRAVVRREAKPAAVEAEEAPAALPPPEP